jgi:hypothetical protein
VTKEHADYEDKSSQAPKRAIRGERTQARPIAPKSQKEAGGLESQASKLQHPLSDIQQQVGNRGVQRLIAQRRGGEAPFDVEDETAGRISRELGGGQPLDSAIAARMGEATGHDLSGVRVHASPEDADLSQQLNARAFTTGQDIFFGEGAYQPGSSGGQELLAHELTHVVQQASGAVDSGGDRMTVNAPGDRFEQEADAVAKEVFQPGATAEIQRQPVEEDRLQLQEEEEDELEE